MRICYISTGNFSHIGPYLEYFKNAGHDVHFICLSPGPARDVPTYNLGFGNTYSQTQGKWKYPFSMIRARRLIKKIKPDIIHAHYATSGGLAALVCGFHPVIVTAHGSDLINGIKSFIWRPLLKKIFNFADFINVVSQELLEKTLSLGINKDKIEVLTPGVDTVKFAFIKRQHFKRNSVLKLVCTRRFESVFDHFTIFNALSTIKARGLDFKMTFVGDGSLLDKTKQLTTKLGLSDKVLFTERIQNKDLPEILAQNDIYLSASLWDGASISLLEAMSSGLFPIVSNIKANTEWIQNGKNGFLHKTGDAEDLANCIFRLLENPEIIQQAVIQNRQKVCEKADRNTNMKILESVYKKLISK
jgi:L-malate glycosyltransferase